MRSKKWNLLHFVLLAAVGLIIGSSVWGPHVLTGKDLLNVGGYGRGEKCQEDAGSCTNCQKTERDACVDGDDCDYCQESNVGGCGAIKNPDEPYDCKNGCWEARV